MKHIWKICVGIGGVYGLFRISDSDPITPVVAGLFLGLIGGGIIQALVTFISYFFEKDSSDDSFQYRKTDSGNSFSSEETRLISYEMVKKLPNKKLVERYRSHVQHEKPNQLLFWLEEEMKSRGLVDASAASQKIDAIKDGFAVGKDNRIRSDGYYLSNHSAMGVDNTMHTVTVLLVFADTEDMVCKFEFSEETAVHITSEKLRVLKSNLTHENINYSENGIFSKNKNEISIKFFDASQNNMEDPREYNGFIGMINQDSLVLDYVECHYREYMQSFKEKVVLTGMKFDFYEII